MLHEETWTALGIPTKPPSGWQLNLLRDYKEGHRPLSIPILDFDGRTIGHVSAMTRADAEDDAMIERFVRWRNQNRSGWLDQRPVTFEGTRRWAMRVIEEPDRIAFLMYHQDRLIARSGLLNLTRWWNESDGLVRGEPGGGAFYMYQAQAAMVKWEIEALRQRLVLSKILSTNDGGLNSCRSMGCDMAPIAVRSVYRHVHPEGEVLQETGSGLQRMSDVSLHYLVVTREGFERGYREWYR
jgi:hypothetical protein